MQFSFFHIFFRFLNFFFVFVHVLIPKYNVQNLASLAQFNLKRGHKLFTSTISSFWLSLRSFSLIIKKFAWQSLPKIYICCTCGLTRKETDFKVSNTWYDISTFFFLQWKESLNFRRCPLGVTVNAMDCRIVVSEFELQSRYHVHLRTNLIGKGMTPPYPPRYELNCTTTILLERWI